jgi:transglutaminase-like putative cysteine protease
MTLFVWTLLSLAQAAAPPAPAQAAAPSLDPVAPSAAERSSPVTYDVELRFVVTAPHHTERLRVWVPIPPSDDTQTVEGTELDTWPSEVEPSIATEPVHGNTFAHFAFDRPQGAQMIRHRFRVTTHELRWNLDADRVRTVAEWPPAFEPYLRSEAQAVVVDDDVRRRALEIVPAPSDALAGVGSVLRWIEANMTYDHARASLRASSRWALANGRGHCSDYHGLCAALGRALGQPTRVAYGLNPFPKDSPSHCKAEIFLPPYGWVAFDLSETQKQVRAIEARADLAPERRDALVRAAHRRLLSGFRDNTWFAQTRGSDYELAPPASRRVPVVRTIWAEADGVPLPEPDPGDATRREFAWMTLHRYTPDTPVSYPFADLASLAGWIVPEESR